MSADEARTWGSGIAHVTREAITVRGLDLCTELIGHISAADLLALEIKGSVPEEPERRMIDALLVALAEHGSTPSTLAARLTYLGSPDMLNGAVAAGLLGAGNRFLGTMEGAARLLQRAVVADPGAGPRAHAEAIADELGDGATIPGLGHPLHKPEDPRSVRLLALARELGVHGAHSAAMEELREVAAERSGRSLPINATGAIAGIASDLGYRWEIIRGFALVARTIGILGHIAEELEHPMAMELWRAAEAGGNSGA